MNKFITYLKSKKTTILIIFLYFVLTLIFTWPIAKNFNSKVTDTGDPFFISWVINSEYDTIKSGDFKNFWNQNIFYPYNNTLAYSDHSLTLTLQSIPVLLFTRNPVILINYLQLLSFFLSAIFGYFLCNYYVKNKKAAILGGFLFGFGSFHVGQISHLQIASYQYLPLTILFFEKYLKNFKSKYGFLFVLAFLLHSFVSIYHFGFGLIALFSIFIFRLFAKQVSFTKARAVKSLGFILILILSLLPMLLPYLKVTKELNAAKPIEEHAYFSADVFDYLMTPASNLFLGNRSKAIISREPQKFWIEHTLYLGIFAILTSILGLFIIKNKKLKIDIKKTQILYLFLGLISVILSFGPFLFQANQNIKLPYFLLYKFVPIFQGVRVPTRVTILLLLSLAILVSFSFAKLLKIPNKKHKLIIASSVFLLIFLENFNAPLTLTTPLPVNKSLFEWTRDNLEKDAAVLNYPFFSPEKGTIELDTSFNPEMEYLRGNVIDSKRIFNGYSGVIPESYTRFKNSLNPNNSKNILEHLAIAANLDIKYLIIHKNYLPKENLDILLKTLKDNLNFTNIINDSDTGMIVHISKLRNYPNVTLENKLLEYRLEMINKNYYKLIMTNKNNKIWVSGEIEKFDIELNYLDANGHVKKKTSLKSLNKPLFLYPNETFETILKIPSPMFTKYSKVDSIVR